MKLVLLNEVHDREVSISSDETYTPPTEDTIEAANPANVTGMPRPVWTDREIGFVLNFADYCLQEHEDYKSHVADELSRFANRKVTISAVENKMRKILTEYSNTKYSELIKKGTRSFDLRSIPVNVFNVMQLQRKKWGLGELHGGGVAERIPSQTVADGPKNTGIDATQPKRKANMRDIAGTQKSYGEHAVSDSEAPSQDPMDDDYGSHHVKKKRKLSGPARKQPSNRQRGHTAQLSKKSIHVQQPHKQNNPMQCDPAAAATLYSQKRKASAADVVDLVGDSSPPPKRQALRSAPEGAKMNDEVPMVIPGVKHAQRSGDVQNDRPARPSQNRIQSKTQAPSPNSFPHHGRVSGAEPTYRDAAVPPRRLANNLAQETAMSTTGSTASGPKQNSAIASVQHGPSSFAKVPTVIDAVRDLAEIVAVLLRQQTQSTFGMTNEVEARLKCIKRTVEREPGQLLAKLLQDLHSADAARTDMRDLVRDLVGRREFNRDNVFPQDLDAESIDKGWKAIRKHIQEAIGFDDCSGPPPRLVDAGYVAARIDDLATNQCALGLTSPKKFLEELAQRLESPHSVQAVIGALLCGWLFSGSEPMCDDVYSSKELELYRALLPDRGAVEVQRLDKLSMKLLFENEKFKKSLLRRRAEKLLAGLESSLDQAWPGAPGFLALNSPQDWAESAVKLKQTLMISAAEFRIHYCMPGSSFNTTLMQAEDVDGFPVADTDAQGKVVVICLFPALITHNAPPFGVNPALVDVLVNNKTFFPTMAEKQALDTREVISKAVVLVI